MKRILGYLTVIFACFILMELNSGELADDIRSLFHKNTGTNSSIFSYSSYIDTIPADYQKILNVNDKDLSHIHTIINEDRGPISVFEYKKQYYLQVFELSNSFNLSVKDIVSQYNVSPKIATSGWLEYNDRTAVDYSYRLFLPEKITAVYLKLLGKNNKELLKNDNMAYYYSLFKSFSIQYKKDGKNEFYAEAKGNGIFTTRLQPLEVLFLKRNFKLYLITISANIENQDAPYLPGTLYNLIKH